MRSHSPNAGDQRGCNDSQSAMNIVVASFVVEANVEASSVIPVVPSVLLKMLPLHCPPPLHGFAIALRIGTATAEPTTKMP
jgi:hypothetical protein